jgi:hypothetical protein
MMHDLLEGTQDKLDAKLIGKILQLVGAEFSYLFHIAAA